MDSHTVRCLGCGTLNRVPEAMEGRPGRCGRCGNPLEPLYSRPLSLNDRDFESFLSGFPGPVLAEFHAPW